MVIMFIDRLRSSVLYGVGMALMMNGLALTMGTALSSFVLWAVPLTFFILPMIFYAMAPRSDPAPGSVRAKDPSHSPVAIFGR